MKPKNDLFLLIKSLSKSEKGYFKKFCNVYSDNKESFYLELFNCIEVMDKYDEKIILEIFKHTKVINQLHVRKNYLFKLILKSLRSYYNNDTIETEINAQVHEGCILREKGLYELAIQTFKNAKGKAENYQLYAHLIEINNKITEIIDYVDQRGDAKINLHLENQKLAKNIVKNEEVRQLRFTMAILYRKALVDKDVDKIKREAEKIIQHKLLNDEKELHNSLYLLDSYYRIHAFNENIHGNYVAEYKQTVKLFELLQKNDTLGLNKPWYYIAVISALCASLTRLKKPNELKFYLDKLEALKTNSKFSSVYLRSKMFEISSVFRMMYFELHSDKNNTKEIILLAKKVDEELPLYESHLLPYHYSFICHNLAMALFFNGEFRESLRWINKIILGNKKELQAENVNIAQLFKLIIQYELNNFDYIEYEAKALIKFYESQTTVVTDGHLLVVDYFVTYFIKINSEKKKQPFYLELRKKLTHKLAAGRQQDDLRNVCVWLDGKITGIPIVRSK